jgi:ABC-type multidrug transport system ATPase subunit
MSALLSINAVSMCHWRDRRPVAVLEGASLDLEVGEFGGIWGDRGAGKTTLAKVAAGLLTPDRGRVTFDGCPLHAGDGTVDGRIGFAARRAPLLEGLTVQDWIATTMLDAHTWRDARLRAAAALKRVDAARVAGEVWAGLSDSERMLAAVAYAIAGGPRLLVVDDPVAGLGVVGRATVMELLRSIASEGVAVLMTAADVTELHGANRIWALEGGRLEGPPARPIAPVVALRGVAYARAR